MRLFAVQFGEPFRELDRRHAVENGSFLVDVEWHQVSRVVGALNPVTPSPTEPRFRGHLKAFLRGFGNSFGGVPGPVTRLFESDHSACEEGGDLGEALLGRQFRRWF